ncbi:MAG: class I SAM-dependent methyltransferase [Anderseniella sp.]|nr:class I SAM-dependent methyltransferase [Anderseniella sp.]
MERDIYLRLDALQDSHWWFCARRDVIRETLKRICPDNRKVRILEAGCGTGGNLKMLSAFGDVAAFEPDREALVMAGAKGAYQLQQGSLPEGIPAYDGAFDMVVALDVLEHVERDVESLAALRKRLAPGGRMVLTVPAFPFLWSRHDETHHHFRRYTRKSLSEAFDQAGFEIEHLTYYNSFLFPLVAALRLGRRALGLSETADDQMPSPAVNKVLKTIFSGERKLVSRFSLPFGVSLLAVARNPGAEQDREFVPGG